MALLTIACGERTTFYLTVSSVIYWPVYSVCRLRMNNHFPRALDIWEAVCVRILNYK